MGLELENPEGFLTGALASVREYEDVVAQLSEERKQEEELRTQLHHLNHEIREKIDRTLKIRSQEISDTYDRQVDQLDAKIRKTKEQREKAKSQGIKGRISSETEELKRENEELRRQFKAMLKRDGAPAFCNSNLFYTLYRPTTFREILGLIFAFLLFFGVIPLGIYGFLLPERKTIWLVMIYLIDILLFGGLYVLVGNLTTGRHGEVIREGQNIRKRIRLNKRKIRSITRSIQHDSNEESYHLEEFDDALAKAQQERTEVIAKKQGAQNTFDHVTKNIITDEIETANRPRLEELTEKLTEVQARRGALETEEKNRSLQISKDYEQYLGKSHMNEEDIERIRSMIQEGRASSIIDAVSILEHPPMEISETGKTN